MVEKLIDRLVRPIEDRQKYREKLGVLTGILGIIFNVILFAVKLVVGILTSCVSITADALNNLSDSASSVATLIGAKLANKPVDRDHPFGHGRIEYITALIVSFLIFLMGAELGIDSFNRILEPGEVEFNITFVIILGCAILVKLLMARYNAVIYKKTGNITNKALIRDSLNDCLATGATIAALLISHFTSFKIADGIIGILVAIVIFYQGISLLKEVIGPLLGAPPEKEMVDAITDIVTSRPEISGAHDLIVHNYGAGRIIASIHAEVPSDSDLMTIHEVIDSVELEIEEKLKIHMCIHMDPVDQNNPERSRLRDLAEEIISAYNPDYKVHDFRIIKKPGGTKLIFDMAVPAAHMAREAQIKEELGRLFSEKDASLEIAITVESSYI
ncbi:MAG: cation transporter [Parasporobacterium sp.]|nr:cation transporter [Parasporobacterium sp.]